MGANIMNDNGWINLSDQHALMPSPGQLVLVAVSHMHGDPSSYGCLRAQYIDFKSKELILADGCEGGWYCEEDDQFYCNEGWYETNEFEETHWRIDGAVEAWQPLPDYPYWANPEVPF